VLSSAQEFAWYVALGTILRGGALAEQGHGAEGIAQLHHGLAAYRATGAETGQPFLLTWLAAAYTQGGHIEEGLAALAEAFVRAEKTREHCYAAEQHRLKGELGVVWK
jgi:predicted ATPase